MLLMIDSCDSFTWNLAPYLGESGREAKVVRNDALVAAVVGALIRRFRRRSS